MIWRANIDAVKKDPTNANILVTMTITNGSDVTVTETIPGSDITPAYLSSLAATRIAIYQAREKSIAALKTGPLTSVSP